MKWQTKHEENDKGRRCPPAPPLQARCTIAPALTRTSLLGRTCQVFFLWQRLLSTFLMNFGREGEEREPEPECRRALTG